VQEEQWEVIALAMVMALAEYRLPDLRVPLRGPEGNRHLEATMERLAVTPAELKELVNLLISPILD
jgi:hypothetical protein